MTQRANQYIAEFNIVISYDIYLQEGGAQLLWMGRVGEIVYSDW